MIRAAFAVVSLLTATILSAAEPPQGFTSLFNGKDLTGWKVPEGDNGHWRVVDAVMDYDAQSESSEKDKSLWSQKEYKDFTLLMDWRIKDTPYLNARVPIVLPDGSHKLGPDGKEITIAVPDSDSGVYLRGTPKSQVNIWCWPIGSGEVYGYRMDKSLSPAVRAGVTPKLLADKHVGEWNAFEITVRGNRLSVKLNGKQVLENAELPGLPEKGPLALQHHGSKRDGVWTSPPSLVQFRNVYIKEL